MNIDLGYSIVFDGGWEASDVAAVLREARGIVLVAHQNADGDAVGSLTGMYALLERATEGCRITPMLPDGVPEDLDWLPYVDSVLDGHRDADACRKAIEEADLIVTLDLNTIERTGVLADMLNTQIAKGTKWLAVDHHESGQRKVENGKRKTENGERKTENGEREAECALPAIAVVEPEISSTCELVYWLMREAFGKEIFSLEAATSLYTGICTDTGTFSYSNDHQSVYLAAAELLALGIDPMDINRKIKNVFSEARLRFFGHALADLTEVWKEKKVALMTISEDEMRRYGVESAELTGLINEVMKLRDIDCGILVREESDRVRLSLRSKSIYDVNSMANALFGGGGHRRAAGATSHLSLSETVEKVKSAFAPLWSQAMSPAEPGRMRECVNV